MLVSLLAAAATVLILRYAVGTSRDDVGGGATAVAELQGILAPKVVTIGTLSILALALAVMGLFTLAAWKFDPTLRGKLDTLFMGVFSAVLPIFATWVGTVLAFVYAKENFQAAAEASRPAPGDRRSVVKIMKEKFEKFEVEDLKEFELKPASEILEKMQSFSRLPVLTKSSRMPIFVIRKQLLFNFIEGNKDKTMKDFLDFGSNRAESQRFGWIGVAASVDDARAEMSTGKLMNLFVNATGKAGTLPIYGCVFDDEALGGRGT